MELIAKNREDFNILRQFSNYSSPLTLVLSIPDNKVLELLDSNAYKKLIKQYTTNISLEDSRPIVSLVGQKGKEKLFIENCDNLTKLYLEVGYSGEIKSGSFSKLFELLRLDLVRLSNNAKEFFSRDISDNDDVNKLFSSRFTTNYKRKRVSINQLCARVKDLEFFNKEIREIKFTDFFVLHNLRIKEYDTDGKTIICEQVKENGTKQEYKLRFFYIPLTLKFLGRGSLIDVMATKLYGNILIDPEIVPLNFPDTFVRVELKTKKRDIPTKLLSAAFAEFIWRLDINV